MAETLLGAIPDLDDPDAVKACCAAIYESEAVRLLLGDSWHPGGTKLTEEIARQAGLSPSDRLVDVACGRGESALALVRGVGCSAVGVDLSGAAVEAARAAAAEAGLSDRATFRTSDAEALPFSDAEFDVALCECALCAFPDKPTAAAELARVVAPGGRVVVADMTLEPGPLPPELASVIGMVLCIAGALPLRGYADLLTGAGLRVEQQDDCRWAVRDLLRDLDRKLLFARIGQATGMLSLDGVDLREARRVLGLARDLVEEGRLSYSYVIARKDPA